MYRGFNEKDEITLWCEGKQNHEDSGKKSGRGNQMRLKVQRNVEMRLSVLLGKQRLIRLHKSYVKSMA